MTKKPEKFLIPHTDTGEALEWVPRLTGGRDLLINRPLDSVRPRGRPVEKEWHNAFLWLAAKIGKEGLPEGRGRISEVAEWLQQWFIDKDRDVGRTEAMAKASEIFKIYDELKNDNSVR